VLLCVALCLPTHQEQYFQSKRQQKKEDGSGHLYSLEDDETKKQGVNVMVSKFISEFPSVHPRPKIHDTLCLAF
jgi:hypothetical protein